MTIAQILNIVDKREVTKIELYATKFQMGIKPGHFRMLDITDPSLDQILNEEIISISAYNSMLVITI